MNSPYILVTFNLNNKDRKKYQSLFDNAEYVYEDQFFSEGKYKSFFNKDDYSIVLDQSVDYIQQEMEMLVTKTGLLESTLMHQLAVGVSCDMHPVIYYFFLKRILQRYKDYDVICLTNSIGFSSFCVGEGLSRSIDFRYVEGRSIKSILKKFFVGFRFSFFLVLIWRFIYLVFSSFKLKIRSFFLSKPTLKSDMIIFTTVDISTQSNGNYSNYYFDTFINSIQGKISYTTITSDFSRHFSMYRFLSLIALMKSFMQSLITTLRILFYIPRHHLYFAFSLINNLQCLYCQRLFFQDYSPKYLLYKDEVYLPGRITSLAVSCLDIKTYGFQHAINSKYHPVYHHLKFYRSYPNLFPNFLLAYGNYSKKLFSMYGYPENKIYCIGSDRIYNTVLELKGNKKNEKNSLLFISPDTKLSFDRVYPNLIKNFDRIYIRPHPSPYLGDVFLFDNDSVNDVQKQYKGVTVIDSKNESVSQSLDRVDYVFSDIQSTVYLDALLRHKVVVYLSYDQLVDYYDLSYWGVQVVSHLDQVDWTLVADSLHVVNEVKGTTTFLDLILNVEKM
tara:strand:- start:2137 stop:3810 length:1674 start_codon:yes stop_codon:yes gene_type:complete